MRIIGGEYRGRIIKMPRDVAVRPTQDRVREAIFNIIREKVPDSEVLDLYAGSGAFGIEAFSRGAKIVIFVDNNTKCINTIKSNISLLGRSDDFSQLFKMDGVKSISKLEKTGRKFDIIFMDPPYGKSLAKNSLIKIDACDILSPHGLIIAEHFKKDPLPERLINLILVRQRKYGDTVISFYNRR
ncbi:MAG: 16S rRNA (guanine(966)-N(2))-methyltransferase RsmD [Omnitrophica bacterium RBG_13_46_9]|nr:MAG: 16S rRNA (guanine(966)-N(2))-methyltransferase RsmD [Omnitrophica bacterium RBG_13_46_9]